MAVVAILRDCKFLNCSPQKYPDWDLVCCGSYEHETIGAFLWNSRMESSVALCVDNSPVLLGVETGVTWRLPIAGQRYHG